MTARASTRFRFLSTHAWYAWFCLAFLMLLVPATGSAQATTQDSVAAAEINEFLLDWRRAWKESELTRRPPLSDFYTYTAVEGFDKRGNRILVTPDTFPGSWIILEVKHDYIRPQNRVKNTFCTVGPDKRGHQDSFGIVLLPDRPEKVVGAGWQILSRYAPVAVCPTWYLGPDSAPGWDERRGIDEALLPVEREGVRAARAALIERIGALVREHPSNNFLVGQQVRFLIDQQDTARAVNAAQNCGATPFWCSLLAGYVENWKGNDRNAQARFNEALSRMDEPLRCELNNVAPLLELELRKQYETLPCATRDSINRVVWWLAQPLWSSNVNARLVEHYARQVRLFMVRSLPQSERFSWANTLGGDARSEMFIRYGWPSLMFWRGYSWDSLAVSHQHPDALPTPPYVTYEYGRGRMHLLPTTAAIRDPFSTADDAWTLNSPPGGDTVIHWDKPFKMDRYTSRVDMRENILYGDLYINKQYPSYIRETLWWPEEHYKPHIPIFQLPPHTRVMFPRDNHAIFAAAVKPTELLTGRSDGTAIGNVSFILSTAPDSFDISAYPGARVGATTVIQHNLPLTPQLAGVEFALGDSAYRTRFSIKPPEPLTAMKPGDAAISEIALVRAPSAGREMPHNTAAILDSLLPSPEISTGNRFAIYWETYGITQREPATYKVTMQRITERTGWQRFVGAIRRAADPNAPVTVEWTEATAPETAVVPGTSVPVLARTLVLETGESPPGDYLLVLEVHASGKSFTSSATIAITSR